MAGILVLNIHHPDSFSAKGLPGPCPEKEEVAAGSVQ